MYVNFGKPISAKEYFGAQLNRFEHAQMPIHVQQMAKSELALVNQIGEHVSVQSEKLLITNFNFFLVRHRLYPSNNN